MEKCFNNICILHDQNIYLKWQLPQAKKKVMLTDTGKASKDGVHLKEPKGKMMTESTSSKTAPTPHNPTKGERTPIGKSTSSQLQASMITAKAKPPKGCTYSSKNPLFY